MSSRDEDVTATTAGAGTDQHVTGTGESGSFITDEPPTSTTPANGSSNAGINALRANREAPGRGPEAMATDDHTEPA
ncbi:hypothetical protein ACIA5D_33200 [Actinoplanes sp. NPDC051513]|uniref:hypothetical protein n=1 Tax=Actinoplanes sp. NPDC051513 TaxID=3363908 RepID=UPI0037A738A2